MARPSPRMRSAKTGSGTSSSGATQPLIGATKVRLDMRPFLTDEFDRMQRPIWLKPGRREHQAEIMRAGLACDRTAGGHQPRFRGRMRHWNGRDLCAVAGVEMHL